MSPTEPSGRAAATILVAEDDACFRVWLPDRPGGTNGG